MAGTIFLEACFKKNKPTEKHDPTLGNLITDLWKKEVGLWGEGSENFVKISLTKQIHWRFRGQNYVQKHCFYKYDRLHCVIITIVSDNQVLQTSTSLFKFPCF